MLIFPLKKEWYEKIKSGEKTIEYRESRTFYIKRKITGKRTSRYALIVHPYRVHS